MDNYELAFRMQMQVPETLDLSKEDAKTKALYGIGPDATDSFGRTPDNGVRGGTAYGRDHNPKAMTMWFAGGGVRAGHTLGATDETGTEAVDCVHHVRDLHVTLLRLLGLDDNKLTLLPRRGRICRLTVAAGARRWHGRFGPWV